MVKGQTASIFALLTALISGTGTPFVTINTRSREAPTSGMESTAFHSQLNHQMHSPICDSLRGI